MTIDRIIIIGLILLFVIGGGMGGAFKHHSGYTAPPTSHQGRTSNGGPSCVPPPGDKICLNGH